MSVAAIPQADALEQLARPRVATFSGLAGEPELHADELARGQLSGERAPVVLVGIADRARAEAAGLPRPEPGDVDSGDAHRACGRLVEAGDDPQQRRLPRAARPEDDAELAALHGEGQALQRRDAALRRRVDAEDVAQLDERTHSNASALPGAGAENARLVARTTSTAAART